MATTHDTDAPGVVPNPAPQRHDIIIDHCRVSYSEAGIGPRTCILIHGMGGCREHWALTIDALAQGRRVVAVDLPGFGSSEMPRDPGIAFAVRTVTELAARSGARQVDLVGHSMGTLVACEVASRHPEVVRRMVLVGGPITSVISLFHAPVATLRRDPRLANFLIEAATAGISVPARLRDLIAHRPWLRRLVMGPYVPHPDRLSAATVRHFLAGAGAPATFGTLRQGFGYDFEPALRGVACPTLLVGGQQDTIAPESDLRAFAARDDTRRVEILPDTGHLPMLEQPDAFNRIVDEFLTESTEAR